MADSAPDFVRDIVSDLPSEWTEGDLQDAFVEANLTSAQKQQLAEYLGVSPDGGPMDVFSALLSLLTEGDAIDALNITANKCLQPTFNINEWLGYNLGPVFLTVLIFAFLQQRKRLCPRLWNGRPGIAYPVNLVDAYDFRIAYSCAFCSCVVAIIGLFTGDWHIDPDISSLPSMVHGTVEFILLIINVMEICFIYYPIFICLTTTYVFLGQIVGFLYTCSWTFIYTYGLIECPVFSSSDISTSRSIYILPIYVCLWYLLLRFFFGILFCMYKMCKAKTIAGSLQITPPRSFRKTHYYQRVKYLFTPPIHQKPTLRSKVRAFFYQSQPGFMYSRRFVVTFAVSALALYQVSLGYMFGIDTIFSTLIRIFAFDGPLEIGFDITNNTEVFTVINGALGAGQDTFWITSYVSLGIMVSFLIHMIVVYRDNTLRLWKGDRSFCPPEDLSFATLVVANLRYSGYQIAYTIWGFVLIQMVLWALVFFIMTVIVQPFIQGRSNYITRFLEDYWLTFVVGYVFYYLQVFVSKLFFLQKKGKILSLNNRRIFHVTIYLLFFLNVSIGLVSCLMRIIKALIFGLLYIGRMDRCILMRGWELWDTGYRSYLGFLLLEVAHTHPVLVTFCHILRQECDARAEGKERYILKSEEADTEVTPTGSNKVAKNRWFVAVMLLRNPSIRKYRSPIPKDIDKGEDPMNNEEEPDVADDIDNDTSNNNSNDTHPDAPPHSTSIGSIAQAAGDAFLETNPVNFV